MSTYAELAALGSATPVFWAEIWGIGVAFTDGVVTAAHFGDGYTETQAFLGALQLPQGAFSRSIDPLSGSGQQGVLSLGLVDLPTVAHPDGYLTWLFGGDRASILRSRLTADVPVEAGPTDLQVANGAIFAGASFPLDVYIGRETIQVQSRTGDTLDNGVRSRWHSPDAAHVDDSTGTWPEVTDHPTIWLGRIVTLFQSYLDGSGALATTDGTTAGARAAAYRIRGVLRRMHEADGVWTLDTHSIDTLLKRPICRGMPRARLGRRVRLRGGTRHDVLINAAPTTTPICDVTLYEFAGGLFSRGYHYRVDLANGVYTRDEFIQALNLALDPPTLADTEGNLTFKGTLTFALEEDALRIEYTTAAAGADVRTCFVHLRIRGVLLVTGDGDTAPIEDGPWTALGVSHEDTSRSVEITPGWLVGIATTTTYGISIPCADLSLFKLRRDARSEVSVRQAEAGYQDETAFAEGDFAVVVSGTGPQACSVVEVDTTDHSIVLSAADPTDRTIVHEGDMEIVLAYRPAEPSGFGAGTLLQALLSTGVGGFNDSDYDNQIARIGAAIPHRTPLRGTSDTESLIDVESFQRFFAESGWAFAWIIEAIYQQTEALKWVQDRLAFLGGYLTVRNGRITAARGMVPLISRIDATIDEDDMLGDGRGVDAGDHLLVIDGVSYACNWDLVTDKALLTFSANVGDGQTDAAENPIAFADHGIIATPEQLGRLALDVLGDHAREAWRYRATCDRLLWSVEPGAVVLVSDEGDGDTSDQTRERQGLPSPDGSRGLSGVSMLVLAATMDFDGGLTQLELAHVRRRRTGIAPSAWISSFTNVGQAVLTCAAQVFRPVLDGVDAAAFSAGDKVRILRVNPTQAGAEPGLQTSEGGLEVASVSGNTITLTGTLAVAWVSGTTPMVLVLDPYQTASQTTAARRWAHAGDASGDIGDTGDAAYEW